MRFLIALFWLVSSAMATAGTASHSGQFADDDERFTLDFVLAAVGPVHVDTSSFAAGGFAPVLSLFDATGQLLQLDSGSSHACSGGASFCWDAHLALDLAAGSYRLVLTQDGNLPLGPTLADGFSMTGQPDYTGMNFLGQPGLRFINADGSARTGAWAFTLQAAAVPEPAMGLLFVVGLAVLAWRRRALLALGIAASLPALALEAPLAADAHVASTQPAMNFGSLPTLGVGGGATSLLRFDLGTLPAGATAAKLVKANLVLYVNRVGAAGALEVQTVNAGWTEAGVTLNTMPPMSGAGSGINVPVGAAGQFVAVDVTNAVKGWITNPATNFGFALTAALAAPGTIVFLDSKENTATAHVARLDLTLADQGPKGDAGPAGAKGERGLQGATGLQGVPGLQGVQGLQGLQGLQGPIGVTGASGPQGPAGPQGPSGLLSVNSWTDTAVSTPMTTSFQFIGPTVKVTTLATQRFTASMSQTVMPSALISFRFDICYRSATAVEASSPNNGYKIFTPTAANVRTLLSVSNSFVLGAGSWVVGPCARLQGNGALTLNAAANVDWSTGWVIVSN